ncbi:MAG: Rpn family recombination-promoting nuclease/putative transposase [Methanosarcinales archaeon]
MASKNKRYDISMKCLAELYPSDLAKLVFGPEFRGRVEFRPETLPYVSARESDLLLLVKNINKDFILHIEFQSAHESDVPIRMLEYYGRIVRHYKIEDVYSVVIYLNPKHAPKEIPDSFTHKFRNKTTLYEYEVIKIWEIESKFIVDNNLVGLFPLLSLTKDCDLRKTYKLIESLNIDITKIRELYVCAFLLAGLGYSKELIKSLTKEEIMLESVTYKEIIEKGIAQGIIKGEEIGIKKGKIDDIILLLRARFKRVPRAITTKIRAIKDSTTLEELIVAAATSNSLEEFEKHLI